MTPKCLFSLSPTYDSPPRYIETKYQSGGTALIFGPSSLETSEVITYPVKQKNILTR